MVANRDPEGFVFASLVQGFKVFCLPFADKRFECKLDSGGAKEEINNYK